VDCDVAWRWLVLSGSSLGTITVGEAHMIQVLTFLERPASAFFVAFLAILSLFTTQSGEMGCRLLAPRVCLVVVAHAVHMLIISLDTHASSIILNPLA
jgi:hypothetical protein